MKRSVSSAASSAPAERTPPAPPDPFRFGWRYVQQNGRNGAGPRVRVALTLDDVLHPQEGDHIPENTQQELDRSYLASVLRYRLADKQRMKVLSDCLIDWGVEGIRDHSVDVMVFDQVRNPNRNWKTFKVVKEDARPVLAIEIVSPDADARQARDNDVVTKVQEYYGAGVPLYVIVDQEKENGPRKLIGYRRGKRGFVRLALDKQGRLPLEPVGLLLGLRDNRVVCFDTDTGEEIGDLTAMARQRDSAETARRAAEAARAAEAEARRATEIELAQALARIHELEARTRRS
jgi:Uma2 family endonuclease